MSNTKKILIADDVEINRELLRTMLSNQYEIVEAVDGEEAIAMIQSYAQELSIVLLDIIMPKANGFDVLDFMNSYGYITVVPVIIITTSSESSDEKKAFELGVSDFIQKPYNPEIVKNRISNAINQHEMNTNLQSLVDEQTAALYDEIQLIKEKDIAYSNDTSILLEAVASMAEFRTIDMSSHLRALKYTNRLLLSYLKNKDTRLVITDSSIDAIMMALVLHDIGKSNVPDSILQKPGPLTDEEYEIVKQHCQTGAGLVNLLSGLNNPSIVFYAHELCLHHHERVDGSGYPDHLSGDEIPVYVQVFSLCHSYDNLVNDRVYRKAISHEEAVKKIASGVREQFSELAMEAFLQNADTIKAFYKNSLSAQ